MQILPCAQNDSVGRGMTTEEKAGPGRRGRKPGGGERPPLQRQRRGRPCLQKLGGALGEHFVADFLTTVLGLRYREFRVFCVGSLRRCLGDALVAANYHTDYRLRHE